MTLASSVRISLLLRAKLQRQAEVVHADLLDRNIRALDGIVRRLHHVGKRGAIRRRAAELFIISPLEARRFAAGGLMEIHGFLFHVVFERGRGG
ncbi:MAG: hypothetical protein NVV63_00325 [Opitutus sp.]|nr:hypothetical protein [Opitutus sp.]